MRFLTSVLLASAVATASANPFRVYEKQEAAQKILEHLPIIHQHIQDAVTTPLQKFNSEFNIHQKFSELADPVTSAPTGGNGSDAGNTSADLVACSKAMLAIQAKATTCGLISDSPTSAATMSPSSSMAAEVARIKSFCDNQSCFTDLQAQIKSGFTVCLPLIGSVQADATVKSMMASFNKLNEYTSVGCNKDAQGNYCLANFLNSAASFADENSAAHKAAANPLAGLSKATLDQMCSPCAVAAATSIASVSGSSDASFARSLNLLCMKDPDNMNDYCLTKLTTFMNAVSPSSSPAPGAPTQSPFAVPGFADFMCSSCYRKMMATVNPFSSSSSTAVATETKASSSSTSISMSSSDDKNPFSSMNKLIDSLCVINENGERCISTFSKVGKVFGDDDEEKSSTGSTVAPTGVKAKCELEFMTGKCSDACREFVRSTLAPFGCCLGSVFQSMKSSMSSSTSMPTITMPTNMPTITMPSTSSSMGGKDPSAAFEMVLSSCGLSSLASPCKAATVKVTQTITLPALSYSFYTKNSVKVNEKLIADIANAAGVSTSQVTITVTQKDKGIAIAVTISAASNKDSTSAQTALNYQIDQKTLAFTQTASFASQPENVATAFNSNEPLTPGSDTTKATQAGTGSATSSSSPIAITGLLALVMAGLAGAQQ